MNNLTVTDLIVLQACVSFCREMGEIDAAYAESLRVKLQLDPDRLRTVDMLTIAEVVKATVRGAKH